MVKFTDEMKDALRVPGKGGSLIYMATSSIDGKPNIAAMRFVATHGDDKILISTRLEFVIEEITSVVDRLKRMQERDDE